jgi:hypothetical protein
MNISPSNPEHPYYRKFGTGKLRFKVKGGKRGGSVTAIAVGAGIKGRDMEIGTLNWGPDLKVHHLGVHMDYQRQGVATSMWRLGLLQTGGRLQHAENRTDKGDKFARSVGGELPPRSDYTGR